MKLAEPGNPARRGWLDKKGLKLVAKPYLSGAFAMQRLLERLRVETVPLEEITAGHGGGIFSGPLFRRVYLTGPSTVCRSSAARTCRSLTSQRCRGREGRRGVVQPALPGLEPGMTLISRSGFNARRRAYVRPDMGGFWGSEDVIKVVPDRSKIEPGYLYAFLMSRFGEVLIEGRGVRVGRQASRPITSGRSACRASGGGGEGDPRTRGGGGRVRAAFQKGITEATRDLFRTADLEDLLDLKWHEQGRDLGFARTGL